jgi:predicted nucleic acid-binding protein
MKVVIDTNCLIASINRNRPEFWLYNAFIDEVFEWFISNEILTEYVEILTFMYSENTAKVNYLVTNDKHLLTIDKKDIFAVQVVDLESFRLICGY